MRLRTVLLSAVSLGLLAPGCIIASPDPLPEPTAVRPNVNFNAVQPPVYQILQAQHGGANIQFTIPFFSEDAGENTWWFLYANWNLEGERLEPPRKSSLPPAGTDEGMGGSGSTDPQAVQFSWTPSGQLSPGCNQLTLLITHESNVDFAIDKPEEMSQAAMVVWWVNVDAPLDASQTLVDCPPPAAGPQ